MEKEPTLSEIERAREILSDIPSNKEIDHAVIEQIKALIAHLSPGKKGAYLGQAILETMIEEKYPTFVAATWTETLKEVFEFLSQKESVQFQKPN